MAFVPSLLHLPVDSLTPATPTTDRSSLIAMGVLVAAVVVIMWRPLLRLLLIALVALVVIGIGVVMTPDLAPPGAPATSTPQPPTSSSSTPAPTPSDRQRAQTG